MTGTRQRHGDSLGWRATALRHVAAVGKRVLLYFALLVGVGAAFAFAGVAAKMMGFHGNELKIVRFVVLGFYVLIGIAVLRRKRS